MHRNDAARGFTLIEVVVALAIVAVGMFAVFKTIGDTTSNIAYLRDRSLAAWIADNQITEMRLSGELPSVEETEGEVDYAGRRWHWVATVSQTSVDGLRRVDVRVRRDEDADGSALVLLAGFIGATATTSPPSQTPWNTGTSAGGPEPDSGDET
jgi:general secretion pathway protein I